MAFIYFIQLSNMTLISTMFTLSKLGVVALIQHHEIEFSESYTSSVKLGVMNCGKILSVFSVIIEHDVTDCNCELCSVNLLLTCFFISFILQVLLLILFLTVVLWNLTIHNARGAEAM